LQGSIGICLGASTVSIAERFKDKIRFHRINHEGKVAQTVQGILDTALTAKVGITGRKFKKLLNIPTVSEPEAVELAYDYIKPSCPGIDCIISAGGETFLVYALDEQGKIKSVYTGNKCASGTGEFFLQQIKRMKLGIEEAADLAASSEPYTVAGRCSVFCKSDCTHALNKGISKGRVCAGLCKMMAGKIIELLKKANARQVAVVGGVSQNRAVMDHVREAFPKTCIPKEACYFEALGALLWAEKNNLLIEKKDLIKTGYSSFAFLPDLKTGLEKVSFKSIPKGEFYNGEYIFGLDVGSTTTKAVLLRTDNYAIVASVYLRTNGDPIRASRDCYRAILNQQRNGPVPKITGLGVTGSGRQIAGLHALTEGVINEIVAHAAAAVYFDPEVETVFEIGGQDAKYTFITNRVASDYAMNEACSAGTGSFLEEACRESFGIKTGEIADIAFHSSKPPNFNDQCSAFVGSDIKTAVQEGVGKEDILAGLVYSVCQNYLNRVKGNRPVGKKVFMQGGVCYNRAVPAAMATLCGQEIIVPPEPGLMGAFGVALEVHRKIENNLLEKQFFDLADLAEREVEYLAPFICNGGAEKCDRKCSISRISINGKVYPFGGACNKYYNLRQKKEINVKNLDLVRVREELVYLKYAPQETASGPVTIGIPSSLFTNTFYPLYAHFFNHLGIKTVRSDGPDPGGMEAAGSSFCFPVVLAHGYLKDLLKKKTDYIFIPHVKNIHLETSDEINCTCPLIQGEPYYLKATFHEELAPKLVTEILNFDNQEELRRSFISIGFQMGFPKAEAAGAFEKAQEAFNAMQEEMKAYGRRFLASLHPEETALVLFGRPYNAFSKSGNMGIPHKFASRGYKVIPYDFLPLAELEGSTIERMYWSTGQGILQAARYVTQKPNLFGVFITSFSCGPDSFITGYFRDIMGQKPFLTLELDAHTADAGVDTRIEAFLDVIKGYRELNLAQTGDDDFVPAQTVSINGNHYIRASDSRHYRITDPAVHVLLPSMGDTAAKGLAAAMRYVGIRATTVTPPGQKELILGKGEATCKECLPLLLTTGSLKRYLNERDNDNEILVYFMPEADGPCRFGQYSTFLKNFIRKNRLKNIALLSLNSENGYAGMSTAFTRRAWLGVSITDGLNDIYAGILALAEDSKEAPKAFEQAKGKILQSIASDSRPRLLSILKEQMLKLAQFKKKLPIREATKVTLAGEIYARGDGFSRQYLVERLAKKNIVVKTVPNAEWLYYTDYCVTHGLSSHSSCPGKLAVKVKNLFMRKDEAAVQGILNLSGFYQEGHKIDMEYLMDRGADLINPHLTGEAILTVSSTLMEIGDETHGVISIGPFGCMPCRIAEAILNYRLSEEKEHFSKYNSSFWAQNKKQLPLPFLAIESDGNAFPQVVEARLESFILSAHRLKAELDKFHTSQAENLSWLQQKRKISQQAMVYRFEKNPGYVKKV
jgi:predicted CoA-substrate-specific enzyme activase